MASRPQFLTLVLSTKPRPCCVKCDILQKLINKFSTEDNRRLCNVSHAQKWNQVMCRRISLRALSQNTITPTNAALVDENYFWCKRRRTRILLHPVRSKAYWELSQLILLGGGVAWKYVYGKLTNCQNFTWYLTEEYFPQIFGKGEGVFPSMAD